MFHSDWGAFADVFAVKDPLGDACRVKFVL